MWKDVLTVLEGICQMALLLAVILMTCYLVPDMRRLRAELAADRRSDSDVEEARKEALRNASSLLDRLERMSSRLDRIEKEK